MSRQNDWARVEQALMLQGKPDCVPLWEVLVDTEVKEAFLGREIATPADDVEFWREAGYDFLPLSVGFLAVGAVIKEASSGQTDSATAYEDEAREVSWADEAEGVITTWEQFESYPWPSPEDISLDELHQCAEALPDSMRIIVLNGKVFTATWMLMGFEGLAHALADDPALAAAVFEKIGSLQYEVCMRCLQVPQVGALWMVDDVAYNEGLLVSPAILHEHVFPWYAKLGAEVNRRGIPYIYHADGNLWPVMDEILACGFNALHPIEPKGMDIREVKAKVGDRLCLTGNIDLDRLARGTPQEIAELVKRNIKDLAYDGGYCVGSSNSVAYYVPLENYVAMIEAAKQYGRL